MRERDRERESEKVGHVFRSSLIKRSEMRAKERKTSGEERNRDK